MLRKTLASAALLPGLLFAHQAIAAEAGKVTFVAGQATVAGRAVKLNDAANEGEMFTTGADGYVYIKLVDNGLFILRPNTTARIVTYRVDGANPANTRIKLELISGVARSKSGDAVKLARQNFRFNTPVAAIGVRGTDFSVSTDQNTSRVAVISGGITVSGFVGACNPEGNGPCEGNTGHELFATQKGQLLQVQRGQAKPVLVPAGANSPDVVAPPRGDEAIGKNAGVNNTTAVAGNDATLDPQKAVGLGIVKPGTPVNNQPPVVVQPPIVTTPPVVVVPEPPVVEKPIVQQDVIWGRWQPLLGKAAEVDPVKLQKEGNTWIATKRNFVLLKTPGEEYVSAERGSVGFALKDSEAYVYHNSPVQTSSVAKIEDAKLVVDFGTSTFTTSFNLVASQLDTFKLNAEGTVGKDGRLYGNSVVYPTNMNVDGQLSNAKGGTAAYLFDAYLDKTRQVSGATYWGKQ